MRFAKKGLYTRNYQIGRKKNNKISKNIPTASRLKSTLNRPQRRVRNSVTGYKNEQIRNRQIQKRSPYLDSKKKIPSLLTDIIFEDGDSRLLPMDDSNWKKSQRSSFNRESFKTTGSMKSYSSKTNDHALNEICHKWSKFGECMYGEHCKYRHYVRHSDGDRGDYYNEPSCLGTPYRSPLSERRSLSRVPKLGQAKNYLDVPHNYKYERTSSGSSTYNKNKQMHSSTSKGLINHHESTKKHSESGKHYSNKIGRIGDSTSANLSKSSSIPSLISTSDSEKSNCGTTSAIEKKRLKPSSVIVVVGNSTTTPNNGSNSNKVTPPSPAPRFASTRDYPSHTSTSSRERSDVVVCAEAAPSKRRTTTARTSIKVLEDWGDGRVKSVVAHPPVATKSGTMTRKSMSTTPKDRDDGVEDVDCARKRTVGIKGDEARRSTARSKGSRSLFNEGRKVTPDPVPNDEVGRHLSRDTVPEAKFKTRLPSIVSKRRSPPPRDAFRDHAARTTSYGSDTGKSGRPNLVCRKPDFAIGKAASAKRFPKRALASTSRPDLQRRTVAKGSCGSAVLAKTILAASRRRTRNGACPVKDPSTQRNANVAPKNSATSTSHPPPHKLTSAGRPPSRYESRKAPSSVLPLNGNQAANRSIITRCVLPSKKKMMAEAAAKAKNLSTLPEPRVVVQHGTPPKPGVGVSTSEHPGSLSSLIKLAESNKGRLVGKGSEEDFVSTSPLAILRTLKHPTPGLNKEALLRKTANTLEKYKAHRTSSVTGRLPASASKLKADDNFNLKLAVPRRTDEEENAASLEDLENTRLLLLLELQKEQIEESVQALPTSTSSLPLAEPLTKDSSVTSPKTETSAFILIPKEKTFLMQNLPDKKALEIPKLRTFVPRSVVKPVGAKKNVLAKKNPTRGTGSGPVPHASATEGTKSVSGNPAKVSESHDAHTPGPALDDDFSSLSETSCLDDRLGGGNGSGSEGKETDPVGAASRFDNYNKSPGKAKPAKSLQPNARSIAESFFNQDPGEEYEFREELQNVETNIDLKHIRIGKKQIRRINPKNELSDDEMEDRATRNILKPPGSEAEEGEYNSTSSVRSFRGSSDSPDVQDLTTSSESSGTESFAENFSESFDPTVATTSRLKRPRRSQKVDENHGDKDMGDPSSATPDLNRPTLQHLIHLDNVVETSSGTGVQDIYGENDAPDDFYTIPRVLSPKIVKSHGGDGECKLGGAGPDQDSDEDAGPMRLDIEKKLPSGGVNLDGVDIDGLLPSITTLDRHVTTEKRADDLAQAPSGVGGASPNYLVKAIGSVTREEVALSTEENKEAHTVDTKDNRMDGYENISSEDNSCMGSDSEIKKENVDNDDSSKILTESAGIQNTLENSLGSFYRKIGVSKDLISSDGYDRIVRVMGQPFQHPVAAFHLCSLNVVSEDDKLPRDPSSPGDNPYLEKALDVLKTNVALSGMLDQKFRSILNGDCDDRSPSTPNLKTQIISSTEGIHPQLIPPFYTSTVSDPTGMASSLLKKSLDRLRAKSTKGNVKIAFGVSYHSTRIGSKPAITLSDIVSS